MSKYGGGTHTSSPQCNSTIAAALYRHEEKKVSRVEGEGGRGGEEVGGGFASDVAILLWC